MQAAGMRALARVAAQFVHVNVDLSLLPRSGADTGRALLWRCLSSSHGASSPARASRAVSNPQYGAHRELVALQCYECLESSLLLPLALLYGVVIDCCCAALHVFL